MKKKPVNMVGAGIAIGAAIGVAIDNVGFGNGLGEHRDVGLVPTRRKYDMGNASGSNKGA